MTSLDVDDVVRHAAEVDGYTVTGRWHYLEYDSCATGGSYIREPAGSGHTLPLPVIRY